MQTQVQPLKIYNASAGSGKTYTLVQDYLKIVLHHKDPLKFRSILAMTFTNKAANEMKERVLSALIDLSKTNHLKTPEQLDFLENTAKNIKLAPDIIEIRAKAILNKILHNYSSFSVMTIDKFTHKIIRTFAKDLDISIDFNVEMDTTGFLQSITDLLMDEIGRNQKLTGLLLRYTNHNLDNERSWNIKRDIYEFTTLLLKEDALEAIEHLKDLNEEDFISIGENLKKENAIILQELTSTAEAAIHLIKSYHLEDEDFASKSNGVYGFFKRTLSRVDALSKMTPPSKTILKYTESNEFSHKKSPHKATIDSISDLLGKYVLQLNQIITVSVPQLKLNKEINKNLNNLAILKYILALIEKVKADENILLLSDFYKEIAAIITRERVPFIYERLGIRYQHFLLDEFQDTSQMQWVNLIPLVHNSLAQQHENLIVGDGKQAIYRWRNGEVEQFTKLPGEIHNPKGIPSLKEAENLFSVMGRKENLESNYRSSAEIVNFNNTFFTELSQQISAPLAYIYDGLNQAVTKKFKGYVEATFFTDNDEDAQLENVLNTVKKAVNAGFSFSDICIITRNNRNGANIANYLTDHDYPVISPDSLFIGKDKYVQFLHYLMQSLTNFNDKNAQVKTIEHYCEITAAVVPDFIIDKSLPFPSLENYFEAFGIHVLAPEHFQNIYEYVEFLLETFDIDATDNVYLQFFMESIHQFEVNKNVNIRAFLDWFKDKGKEKSIISPEGSNAISIMTIHKSKGLQFPVVICPLFNWSPKLDRQQIWVIAPGERLPAYFVKTTKYLAETPLKDLYEIEKAKFELDTINMLYVAFTRPEIALFITGDMSSTVVKNQIEPLVKNMPDFSLIGDTYRYGELINYKPAKKVSKEKFEIQFLKQKMNKPSLSYKSALEWDIESLDEKRNFGTMVHHVLSILKTPQELPSKLKELAIKQGLTNKEVIALEQYISPLFKNERFAAYFTPEAMNETALIDNHGMKFIPDKIIQTATEVLVVDFKTGQNSPAHLKQVGQYIKLLKDMGHDNVNGELCYTEGMTFITV
ncbi:hypothetical protein DNU06_12835 [Putridiphycobacter roseus]|uniref:DNA 3'-5' helicase n=1 Tax=Putridiphycobacter roseus TaxID=2219161 RepID=A0A2W1MYW8_9FLAO|nr:UvrD-helicase domain-containing protein [Putridiphycobacter roseus]PZE16430.1 hypothetical protein DNU06_12835 [Putridiphycobacter roseus]